MKEKGCITRNGEIVSKLNTGFYKMIRNSAIVFSPFALLGGMGVCNKWVDAEDVFWIGVVIISDILLWGYYIYFSKKKIVIGDEKIMIYLLFHQYNLKIEEIEDTVKYTPDKIVFYLNNKKITTLTPIYQGYEEIKKRLFEL